MRFKRILCGALTFVVLACASIVPVFAGNTTSVIGRINTSTISYVGQTAKKTEYFQLGSYLNATGAIEANVKEPNAGYYLNVTMNGMEHYYNNTLGNNGLAFFLSTEGYVNENGEAITSDASTSMAVTAMGDSTTSGLTTDTSYDYLPNAFGPNPNGGDCTEEEKDYATKVATTLSASLNQILATVNDGNKFSSVASMVNASILIRPNDSNNISYIDYTDYGYALFYASPDSVGQQSSMNSISSLVSKLGSSSVNYASSNDFLEATNLPAFDMDGNLLVYVVKYNVVNGSKVFDLTSTSPYVYAMEKGYRGGNLFHAADGSPYTWSESDIKWFNIHMLAQCANYVFKTQGISTSTQVSESTNFIEEAIFNMANDAVKGLYSFLGLSTTNDLVYNGGARSSSSWNYGTMSDGWWNVVLRYHVIFQGIAWFILIVGFFKTLLSLNYSTVNPMSRESVYESIKRFIVVGFLLALIIPTIQFLMGFNNAVVGIFASQVQTELAAPSGISGFNGIIVFIFYMIITVYMNFLYVMRSITIALLIVSAPLFIATIAVTKKAMNQYVMGWAKELISNIFIQSVHAFVLAFLTTLMQNGTTIETLIISFSIIPITEMFRNLVLAGGASNTEGIAKGALAKTTSFASGVVSRLAGGAGDATAGLIGAGAAGAEQAAGGMGGGKAGGTYGGRLDSVLTACRQKITNNATAKYAEASANAGTEIGTKARRAANRSVAGAGALAGAQFAGRTLSGIGGFFSNAIMGEATGQSSYWGQAGKSVGDFAAKSMNSAVTNGRNIFNSIDTMHAPEMPKIEDDSILNTAKTDNGISVTAGKVGTYTINNKKIAEKANILSDKENLTDGERVDAAMALATGNGPQSLAQKLGFSGSDVSKQAQDYLRANGIGNIQPDFDSKNIRFDRNTNSYANTTFAGAQHYSDPSTGKDFYEFKGASVSENGAVTRRLSQKQNEEFLRNISPEEASAIGALKNGQSIKLNDGSEYSRSNGVGSVTYGISFMAPNGKKPIFAVEPSAGGNSTIIKRF